MTKLLDQALDRLVPPFTEETRRWDDVLRRAGSAAGRRRWRPAALISVAAAAVLVGAAAAPPLGVGGRLLDLVAGRTHTMKVRLPKAADRAHVAVVLDPATGRVELLAAPKRKDEGMCYAFFPGQSSGCSLRSGHGAGFSGGVLPIGYTFDARARSADVRLASGKRVQLRFVRFRGRIGTAFFFARHELHDPVDLYYVRDRAGTVIIRGDLRRVR
jgi:hypothetical protein